MKFKVQSSKFKVFLAATLACCSAFAQTTSQVNGNVALSMNYLLANPQPLYTNTPVFSFPQFINGQITWGTNGVGAGHANQLFIGQFSITNGALAGTNVFNLHTLTMSNMPSGNITPNDAVGNAFALLNVKMIAIQNIGVSNAPSETNVLSLTTAGMGAIAWTNQWGQPNFSCTLPGPATNYTYSNTPTAFYWVPGDIGTTVGATASNSIVFTNPVANSSPLLVNVYVIGSTNQ